MEALQVAVVVIGSWQNFSAWMTRIHFTRHVFVVQDDGLGSTSVGVLYLSLTFSSLGAPLIVVWLGSKRALLVGLSGYWAFTSANLYPTWYAQS